MKIQTERGSREFASGDRVMFLQNERSLGVKNGTLGTVERVSSARMEVRLDDGRSAAFDLKDYAALDHGYAATVHKAQGVTADRVHVLATPGLDSHAAYVALSRHRERVDLHYGHDDFADQRPLVRALSQSFHHKSGAYELVFDADLAIAAETRLFAPKLCYPDGYDLAVDGESSRGTNQTVLIPIMSSTRHFVRLAR